MMGFDQAFDLVLQYEGGYVNDPLDHGGATKYGITIGNLSRWQNKVCTPQDVHDLTIPEAKQIYKTWYWDKLSLDQIASPVLQTIMFDQGVLNGVPFIAERVQALVGAKADGVIGHDSVMRINSLAKPEELAKKLMFSLQLRYVDIVLKTPTQIRFLKGWLARTQHLLELV